MYLASLCWSTSLEKTLENLTEKKGKIAHWVWHQKTGKCLSVYSQFSLSAIFLSGTQPCHSHSLQILNPVFVLAIATLIVIGLKESHQFFNQWEAKPKPIAPCTRDYRWLLGIVIGSSRCSFLLWLVGVIALVLVFRQSFENHSNLCWQDKNQRTHLITLGEATMQERRLWKHRI